VPPQRLIVLFRRERRSLYYTHVLRQSFLDKLRRRPKQPNRMRSRQRADRLRNGVIEISSGQEAQALLLGRTQTTVMQMVLAQAPRLALRKRRSGLLLPTLLILTTYATTSRLAFLILVKRHPGMLQALRMSRTWSARLRCDSYLQKSRLGDARRQRLHLRCRWLR
jgi:hypothetical protein